MKVRIVECIMLSIAFDLSFEYIIYISNINIIHIIYINCMNKKSENNLLGITKEWFAILENMKRGLFRVRARRKDFFWSRSSQAWTDPFRHSVQRRNDFCSRRKDFFLCNALHKLEMLIADFLHLDPPVQVQTCTEHSRHSLWSNFFTCQRQTRRVQTCSIFHIDQYLGLVSKSCVKEDASCRMRGPAATLEKQI